MNKISRRHFIKGNLAAALAVSAFPNLVPSSVFGATAPSNRIQLGCIGVGPQGRGDMGNFLNQGSCRVVAACDVYKPHLEQARDQINQTYKDQSCAVYENYKDLLDRKDIDAVLIATPDHWHVPVAMAAAKAKKHIYLEKPMGLSIEEDLMLRQVVKKNNLSFQFGTQQRSSDQFRQACELVLNGRIGTLKQINVWCSASRPGGSSKVTTAPEGLNYEKWLGPAPSAPYTEDKAIDGPNGRWKTWWYNYDYALGFIAGWGVHPLDIALWGFPRMMKAPLTVEGRGFFPSEGACNTSVAWDVLFNLADGVKMRYRGTPNGYSTINEMNDFKDWSQKYGGIADHGTAFEGSDGWVLVDRTTIRTYPEKLVEEKIPASGIQLMRSGNHAQNLLEAIAKKGKTICPIEEAVQADILCHLSDLATRLQRPLKFDPSAGKYVNDSEANRKMNIRSRRAPYSLK
jgi:predicted dehydrogenase